MKRKEIKDVFCCADLFSLSSLKDAKLLAGEKGLMKPVSRVNVMEVPDVINWVRRDEFLITTGYSYRDNPKAFVDLLPQFQSRGVSAIGIKTKRFIETVPAELIECANKMDFPLIELPPSTTFSDVVKDIMENVLSREFRNLSILQNRIQSFTTELIEGKGVRELLVKMERTVDNPIVLLDSNRQPIFLTQAFEELNEQLNQVDWASYWDDLMAGTFILKAGGLEMKSYPTRVPVDSMLVLFEYKHVCNPVDILTVSRISELIGLEIINENARKALAAKYIDQFLQDWLTGRFGSISNISAQAKICGIQLSCTDGFRAIAVKWADSKPTVNNMHDKLHEIRQSVAYSKLNINFTVLNDELIAIYERNEEMFEDKTDQFVFKKLRIIISQVFGEKDFSLCVGKVVHKLDLMQDSYSQAKLIHKVSIMCGIDGKIITYDQLGVFSLLYLLPKCAELNEYKDRYLLSLKAYDSTHHTFLVQTLSEYYKRKCSVKDTAKALFTHYNTVVYRLERIHSILKMDISDPEVQLQIKLAYKLEQMYEDGNQNSEKKGGEITKLVI